MQHGTSYFSSTGLKTLHFVVESKTLITSTASALPDLKITRFQLSSPASGRCNTVRLAIKNIGNQSSQGAKGAIVSFPSGTPFNNRQVKKLYIAPIKAGGSRVMNIGKIGLPLGNVTLQVAVNAPQSFVENDFGNNSRSLNLNIYRACNAGRTNVPVTGACDLELKFTAPSGQNVTGNQAFNLSVRAKNVGSASCPARNVRLTRYNNTTGSGYGSQIGGSGGSQPIGALSPGQYKTLNWVEQLNSGSAVSYKALFTTTHNDANNYNHKPLKKVLAQ